MFEKLEAQLNLDASDFRKGIQKTEKDVESLSSKTKSAGKSMQGAGKAMTAGVTTSMAAMGGASVKAAADFDQAMQESIAVMGDVDDNMRDNLESTARDVATSMSVSHEEAASSFYYLSSAGLEAAESIEAMPKVAEFAEAGQMDMARATDVATNVMSAFGYEAEEMTEVTDTLSGTVSNHNQTMEGMSNAMADLAPVASSLGFSIEETSAAVGMLGDVGIQGQKAGVALRNVFSSLSDETSTASEELTDMGVTLRDNEGNLLSFEEILRNMGEAGVEAADASRIFGTEAGPAMSALLDQGADSLDENTQKLKEMDGATKEIAETQRDTLNAELSILKSNLTDVGIVIGNRLLPVVNSLVQRLQPLGERFKGLSESQQTLIISLGALAAAAGPVLFALGTFLTVLPAVGGALATVAGAFGPVVSVVGILLGPLGTLGGLFVSLISPIISAVGAVTAFLGPLGGLLGSITALLGPIGLLIAAIGGIAYVLNEHQEVIREFANKAIDYLTDIINEAVTWLEENGPGLIKSAFEKIGEGIRLVVLDIYNAITGNGDSLLKSILIDAASWIKNNGPGMLKRAIELAIDVIWAAFEGLYEGLIGNSLIPEMFEDIVNYITNTATSIVSGAIDTLIEGAKSAFEWLTGTGDNTLYGDVQGAIEDIAEWISNFDIVGTIEDLFDGAGSAASEAFKGAFNSAFDQSIDIPEVDLGPAGTYGGGSIELPSLDSGGVVEEDGLAMIHEGEHIWNPAKADKGNPEPPTSGRNPQGSGGGDVVIDFGDLDNDDYVSVGALKKMIKDELSRDARIAKNTTPGAK